MQGRLRHVRGSGFGTDCRPAQFVSLFAPEGRPARHLTTSGRTGVLSSMGNRPAFQPAHKTGTFQLVLESRLCDKT